MFDTYRVTAGPDTVYHRSESTVHEHRAPTDDSVKLLKEMQEKAVNSLIGNLATTNNTLQVTAMRYKDYHSYTEEWQAKFTLNGKDHLLRVPLPVGIQWGPQEAARELHKALSQKIAEVVLREFSKELTDSYRAL